MCPFDYLCGMGFPSSLRSLADANFTTLGHLFGAELFLSLSLYYFMQAGNSHMYAYNEETTVESQYALTLPVLYI